ncbi:hypothetical protein QE152_g7831 [Popillia japonica]|uniref:Uncharacterized protein n=1 Tax=Popillia japonica TaxID=7064 RepID=A0AAW1ME32_POPJA
MANELQQSLKELKYQRGRIKSVITKFNIYIDNVRDKLPLDVEQITSRLSRVKDSWSEFKIINAKISTTEEDENNIIEADAFEDNYLNVLG